MAFLDGDNYKLFVEGSTAGTLALLKGQRELSHDTALGNFSRSTKDSKTDIFGSGSIGHTVTVAYLPDLPDADGATRIHTRATAHDTMRIQIREAPFAADDVVFDCVMIASGYNTAYPFRDATGKQLTLVPAAAPTVNLLTPA